VEAVLTSGGFAARGGILTSIMTARLALAAAATAVGLAAPARAQAPLQLPGPTTVSAYRGTIAFSELSPASHRWSLMLRTGDTVTAANVAPRSVPFDVDLGPDAHGRTVAVYSRCATEPTPIPTTGAIAYPSRARGCRVYLYDPAAGTERRRASGYLPAIWKGRIVLARGDRDAALYALASGRARRLDDGGRLFCRTHNRECERGSAVRYTGVDLAGSRVAVARELEGIGEFPATQMVLTGRGRRPVVVEARANGLSFRAMRFPTLDAGRLYYAEACAGDPASCLRLFRRYSIATGTLASAPSPSLYLVGFSQSGPDAHYVQAAADYGANSFENACQGEPPDTTTACTLSHTRPRYARQAQAGRSSRLAHRPARRAAGTRTPHRRLPSTPKT
jgi:hypothetical protein